MRLRDASKFSWLSLFILGKFSVRLMFSVYAPCQPWRSKPSRRASLEGARALLERARGRQSADRSGINIIGARDIGHRRSHMRVRTARVAPDFGRPVKKGVDRTVSTAASGVSQYIANKYK